MGDRLKLKRLLGLTLLLTVLVLACSAFAVEQPAPERKPVPSIISETQPIQNAANAANAETHLFWKISGAVIFILTIFGGFMGYLFYLQKKFFQGCQEEKQMATFFNSPAGLPVGTIRAVIALIIITVSLSLIVLSVFDVGVGKFPDMLVGLLGTVLGFYFGSRSAGVEDGAAQQQIKELKTQRDEAVNKQDATQSDSLISKIKDGIAMSKTALQFLPEAERNKYGEYISKLDQGLTMVDSISRSGDLKQAAAKASEIYDIFRKGNPAQGAFNNAIQAFGQILGNTVPVVAIASTVIVLCTKLAGTVYQKWKARVLHAPFSPAIIPLKIVDANTGFTLLISSPIFKKVFAEELNNNDRPFMDSVTALLGKADVEDFWAKYRERFASREQFETGLEEFRRAAVDLELQGDISSSLLAEAGGYKTFMDSIDKIAADPAAKASLDQLFIVTESLHKSGKPVLDIVDQAKSGV